MNYAITNDYYSLPIKSNILLVLRMALNEVYPGVGGVITQCPGVRYGETEVPTSHYDGIYHLRMGLTAEGEIGVKTVYVLDGTIYESKSKLEQVLDNLGFTFEEIFS